MVFLRKLLLAQFDAARKQTAGAFPKHAALDFHALAKSHLLIAVTFSTPTPVSVNWLVYTCLSAWNVIVFDVI
jgi:hypothetical protein